MSLLERSKRNGNRRLVVDGPPDLIISPYSGKGKVIPSLLAWLDGAVDREPYRTPKGTGWILTWSGDRLLALSRI